MCLKLYLVVFLYCLVFPPFHILVTDTLLDPMTPDFEFLDYILRDRLHVYKCIYVGTPLLSLNLN